MNDEWSQWDDLSPEKEQMILEKMGGFLIQHDLDDIALLVIESSKPLITLFAEFWMGLYGPYLDYTGTDRYLAFFRKKKNVNDLIHMLRESKINS